MRVLLVVHGFPPHALGGTEIYAEAHARTLARSYGDTVLVLAREADSARPELALREEARDGYRVQWINHTFRESTSIEDAWRAPRVAAAVAPVVDAFAPDVAHIHHLTCLSTLLPSMLATRRVPVAMTLHDYWLMCHRGQLLDTAGARCDGPGDAGCRRCIEPADSMAAGASAGPGLAVLRAIDRAAPRIGASLRAAARTAAAALARGDTPRRISRSRTAHIRQEVLPHVDRFFAPSAHVRDRFVRFGVPGQRITVAPYGIPEAGRPTAPSNKGPLRVGYLGTLMLSKAPHLVMDAVARLPAGAATLDVFGGEAAYHGDASYSSVIEQHARHPAITVHGPLAHERVADVLASLDVLAVPSVWEETSSFVILEAFRAGVPVVASRIGGIRELVDDGVNGWLVEPGDAGALAEALGRLAADRALLGELRAHVPGIRRLSDAVAELRESYTALTARADQSKFHDRVAAVVLHYGRPDETALAVRALRASNPPLSDVIVVDNDPDPGPLDLGKAGLPVDRLVPGRNLGFSGGMNVGIGAALDRGAAAVLLVNSDVIVPPGTAAALMHALRAHPDAGIVAPVVLDRQQPGRIASMGIHFNRLTGRMRNLEGGRPFDPEVPPPAWRRVDAVNGAVMLISRAAFERAGLFDEAYFFSFEEIEFCLRAADYGLISAVTGDAVAYHQGGASLAAGSSSRSYYAARNHLRLASRAGRAHRRTGVLARGMVVIILNVSHAVLARGGRRERLAATWRGIRDYARGRFGPDPLN